MQRLGHHVPALDGVRALAIASVLLYHATGFPAGGALGVSLFFVLSGYLITTLLLDERDRAGSVSFAGFYRRRALRLLPALWAMLPVGVLVYAIKGDDRVYPVALSALAYVTNVPVALREHSGLPLAHLWSLAAEAQFYVLWPVFLVMVMRARVKPALGVCVLALVIVVIHAANLAMTGATPQRIWFAPDSGSAPIIAGCALALALRLRPAIPYGSAIGIVGLCGYAALVATPMKHFTKPGMAIVVSIACTAMLVGVLAESRTARVLQLRPLAYVGRISYSLYLWHWVVLVALGLRVTHYEPGLSELGIALSVVVAVASYHLIELPFLRRKRSSHRVAVAARPLQVSHTNAGF